MGLGRSSLGAEPRSTEQIASELHGLLEATGAVAPYVLVGHSYGGLLIRVFAHRYPTEIAGLVFIDPATEGMYDHIQKEMPREWEAAATALTEGFRRQWLGMPEAIDQARKAWPLPEVPTTVISADTPLGQWPLKTAQDVAVLQKEQMVLLAQMSGASHCAPLGSHEHPTQR